LLLGIHKVFLRFLPNLPEENCKALKMKSVSMRFGGLSAPLGFFLPSKRENVKGRDNDSFSADLSNYYAAYKPSLARGHFLRGDTV